MDRALPAISATSVQQDSQRRVPLVIPEADPIEQGTNPFEVGPRRFPSLLFSDTQRGFGQGYQHPRRCGLHLTEINRLYRGIKLLEIGAGTTEVRKLIIAQELLEG